MTRVVAIAGPVGGGKTTLTRALAARLPGAVAIHFDDYKHTMTARHPRARDIGRWLASGAEVNDFEVAPLVEDLRVLRSGGAVRGNRDWPAVRAGECVVFETHFGREHRDFAALIDWQIWLDTPLDVALARKVRQLADTRDGPPGEAAASEWIDFLREYLGNYVDSIAAVTRLQRERIRSGADQVLDGTRPLEALVETAARAILDREPAASRGP